MYRFDSRVCLLPGETIEEADVKIKDLVKTLHLTLCKISQQQKGTMHAVDDLEDARKSAIDEFRTDQELSDTTREVLLSLTKKSRDLTEEEVKSVRSALDLIQNIRALREERRVVAKEARSTRRGVLMAQLQAAAKTTPLWIGAPGEACPPLCGATPSLPNHVVKAGDKVAAKVDENWILAEFISYEPGGQIIVEDIDAVDSSKSKITLSKKKMIALPHWRANPVTEPSALHQINSQVMALYPQTTCFYKGTVAAVPEKPNEDYIVLFEDSTYPMGYSPPMPVAQKYIVEFPDEKPTSSSAKRKDVKTTTKFKGKGAEKSKNSKKKR